MLTTLTLPTATHGASRVDVFHFDSDEQRARYRSLIAELRCPKCLNINIAGSDAPIAQDLRALVHRLVVIDGKTDEEVLAFVHARYGDFVLYDPPLNQRTWLIWFLPFGVAIAVVAVLTAMRRRAVAQPEQVLTDGDRERLARLLDDDNQD